LHPLGVIRQSYDGRRRRNATVDEHDWLAEQFEIHRAHLRSVAFRMLGSLSEADDAVQEAWLRLGRSGIGDVQNLRGWLTTVIGRICLDMLRARRSRREEPLDQADQLSGRAGGAEPQDEALLAESVGFALLIVLEALGPAERVAFVLHDIFAVPYAEIGPIVGRSESAARMLASRARRRVQNRATVADADLAGQREIVDAFLAAARDGDFEALLAVLDPDVEVHADGAAVPAGVPRHARGADSVAGRALLASEHSRFAQVGLVNGAPGIVVAPRGRLSRVLTFQVARGRITRIDVFADPSHLRQLDIGVLPD
jgi:RNA polymerase sigma factor (sigma-70 family)